MNDWLESATGIRLADPPMLALLALVPLALWLRRRRGAPAIASPALRWLAAAPSTVRARVAWLPASLRAAALGLAILALARPVQPEASAARAEGIDVLLVIDLSSSMSETDMDPAGRRTRLDVAKEAAAQFVEARRNDRLGLVTFAAFPDVRCPPTLDHDALSAIVGDLRTVAPRTEEDRTGIGLAVARAARVLRGSAARSKVAILLTDGQENVHEVEPAEAAKLAKSFGVKVYTIGAGLGVRLPFGGMRAIDFSEMRALAGKTGGRFFHASDAGALASTYVEIDRLERSELEDPRVRLQERFLWLLAPALAAFALAALLEASWLQVLP